MSLAENLLETDSSVKISTQEPVNDRTNLRGTKYNRSYSEGPIPEFYDGPGPAMAIHVCFAPVKLGHSPIFMERTYKRTQWVGVGL